MPSLDGQVAIVTGAGRGIGRAVALALAAEGADLALCDLDPGGLNVLAEELRETGRRVYSSVLDVCDEDAVTTFVDESVDTLGRIDILVNNAGTIVLPGDLLSTTTAAWERTMAVNATGPFLLCRSVLPHLQERGGRIIMIGSTAGLRGLPERVAYCASKHAVVGLTRALAAELRYSNVSVNAVCPGAVVTPLTEMSRPEAGRAGWLEPADIARAVCFFAADTSRTHHGVIMELDDRS